MSLACQQLVVHVLMRFTPSVFLCFCISQTFQYIYIFICCWFLVAIVFSRSEFCAPGRPHAIWHKIVQITLFLVLWFQCCNILYVNLFHDISCPLLQCLQGTIPAGATGGVLQVLSRNLRPQGSSTESWCTSLLWPNRCYCFSGTVALSPKVWNSANFAVSNMSAVAAVFSRAQVHQNANWNWLTWSSPGQVKVVQMRSMLQHHLRNCPSPSGSLQPQLGIFTCSLGLILHIASLLIQYHLTLILLLLILYLNSARSRMKDHTRAQKQLLLQTRVCHGILLFQCPKMMQGPDGTISFPDFLKVVCPPWLNSWTGLHRHCKMLIWLAAVGCFDWKELFEGTWEGQGGKGAQLKL